MVQTLETRALLSVAMVRDIDPRGQTWDSDDAPQFLTEVNGTLYFMANDGIHGAELWKSDGTSAGTVLVKDIEYGYRGSYAAGLTNVNGTLFFSAVTESSGIELWKSDGTSTGTVLVKDIEPSGNSYAWDLTNVNGILFFSASNAAGNELWKSNGTSTGTVLVKDINPNGYSTPYNLTNVNGTLYFIATDVITGGELWKSNGTSTGTVLVKDIFSGSDYCTARQLTNVNGTLYFQADNGINGSELWKSDGTSAGTVMVKDINTSGSSYPYELTNVNGTLFFRASNGSGSQLWKSNGTSTGTVLVKTILGVNNFDALSFLTNVNGTLFFAANDGINSWELWKSDGTSTGTQLVRDIWSGGEGSQIGCLTNVNGTLFFAAATSSTSVELWKSDGTSSGTVLVQDINSGSGQSFPDHLTNINGTLYFTATDGVNGYELWRTVPNAAPTNLALSAMSIAENQSVGTVVGSFSTTDPDAGDTFSYSLVTGTGSTDNGSFTIAGGTLKIAASFDYETKNSYSIRVRSTDACGLFFEKPFTITVTNVNETPTNITLSASSIAENLATGTAIGSFSTTDPDAGNTFSYALVSGTGSTDNGSFTIEGGTLKIAASFDYETKNSYSIRVRSTDQGGLWFENQFTITVTDVNETPTNIILSATSIAENLAVGTAVGGFSTTDPDVGNTFTYSLMTGTGSTDNGSFTIESGTLKTAASFDYETKSSYAIRVRSTDQGGLWVEQTFTITVSNVNETPTNITLSATSIPENQAIGTSVGTFSTTDPDAGNTFSYSLVSGTGSTDNGSFTIDGGTLKTNAVFDFETKSSYSILVRTTDQGGLSFEKQFTITVLDGNDVPTGVSLSNVVSELLASANTTSAIRLADVVVTDDGLGTNTFSLSGADASVFEVVAGQLRLKAGTVLNYATQKTYAVTVNVDDTSLGNTPDVSVDYFLTLQGLDGTTVQNGSVGRSYVRYVSLDFGTTLALADAVATVGTANPRIRLFFGGLTGTQAVARKLTAGMVSLVGNRVKLDFGVEGVGGDRKSSLGDGIYRLRVDLDGDGTAEITDKFFRLLGDVDGNGVVNDADVGLVTAAQGTSGLNLATDLNGDGVIDEFDVNNVRRRKGAKVTV
jgi:ELWxxDGT repeat protein